jgi:AbrB family looped-hinge helix DNA binding protein
MRNNYSVRVDDAGAVLIPAEVRKAMGIGSESLLILSQVGDEIRLAPSEPVPARRVRIVPREELAQALIDGAITPEGMEDAKAGIRELGLDPAEFTPNF